MWDTNTTQKGMSALFMECHAGDPSTCTKSSGLYAFNATSTIWSDQNKQFRELYKNLPVVCDSTNP